MGKKYSFIHIVDGFILNLLSSVKSNLPDDQATCQAVSNLFYFVTTVTHWSTAVMQILLNIYIYIYIYYYIYRKYWKIFFEIKC